MSELLTIQQTLKAPKGQFNGFGKYKYRSCEDILEALKEPLKAVECYLIISDSIELVGDRYYVKATATLKKDGKELDSVSAYAREALTKKGMDDSQITGGASSYARKYALNGLFAIDDTKDSDTNENAPEAKPVNIMAEVKMITESKSIAELIQVWSNVGSKFKGKKELKDLIKAKDARKMQLTGEA